MKDHLELRARQRSDYQVILAALRRRTFRHAAVIERWQDGPRIRITQDGSIMEFCFTKGQSRLCAFAQWRPIDKGYAERWAQAQDALP